MNRADFYRLPIPCEAGHEQYEPLARWIAGPPVNCSQCGRPILVGADRLDEVQRIIDDLNALEFRAVNDRADYS